jgi:ceramide glucosyltransferase
VRLFGEITLLLALVGLISSSVFLLMVIMAAARYRRLAAQARAAADAACGLPSITVLKPLHGMEPHLAENLASFFEQDYPDFEIIFGARDEEDGAIGIVEQLRARYPHVNSRIVFSGPPSWPSAKVFSLDKMLAFAANKFLVISDSDVLASRDCLRQVVTPLLDPAVGFVTCMYQGIPTSGFWSLLEGLGMSVEMSSGVMVADMVEGMRFALGPVMATRADVLDAIGGITKAAEYYSDDFVLGNLTWAAGYKVVLSQEVVGHVLTPVTLAQSFSHQLRWMQSTRYSRPSGHVGTGLTYAMPFGVLALLGGALSGHNVLGLSLFAAAYLNRATQSIVVGRKTIGDRRALRFGWLYPVRDLLGFCVWAASFIKSEFSWGGENYHFEPGGRIVPENRSTGVPLEPQSDAADSEKVLT